MRKKWDGQFHEGKVTGYDVSTGFCKIKHDDGDGEDVDHHEVARHGKMTQRIARKARNKAHFAATKVTER